MNTYELEAKCRELRRLQSLIEEAQAEAETIKDEIKAFMGDSEAVRAGEYRVTWKSVKAATLDVKALRQANPLLCDMYTRQTISRRFCVV